MESLKVVLVECAIEDMEKSGDKVNVSRIATVTGVHRKDVTRIHHRGEVMEQPVRLASRVIRRWREDKSFRLPSGRPKILSYQGEGSEFAELVRKVTSDVRSAAVLFELERIGAVRITRKGLRLMARGYMPTRSDPQEGYRLLANDTKELMEAVTANLSSDEKQLPNYHGRITYDNLAQDQLPKIRDWMFRQCALLHARAERYLAKNDLDLNPRSGSKGKGRFSLCIFTNTHPTDPKD